MERFRKSKNNGITNLKFKLERRQSKGKIKVWMLLSEPKHVNGLSVKKILGYIDGQTELRSSGGRSLYRRLLKMEKQGTITRELDAEKKETLWKKNQNTPTIEYLQKKYFSPTPPWAGICGKGCWNAKNDDCLCSCNGVHHGKGNKKKKNKTPT